MPKRLSQQQREQYLARHGIHCPHCDSTQLDALGRLQVNGATASIETICVACGETWRDIYTLTNIKEERKTPICQKHPLPTRSGNL